MARKKKVQGIRQVAAILAVLVALQLGYLFIIPHEQPQSIRQSIESALEKQQNLDPKRKELLKVQLALSHYQDQNKGELPASLNDLVPVYFDTVPRNPETGEQYTYSIQNGNYVLGGTGAKTKNDGNIVSPSGEFFIPASVDAPLSEAAQKALLGTYDRDPDEQHAQFLYDPTGKRDPFKVFDFSPDPAEDENKTPLERYDINQLKLTAIIAGGDNYKSATVENAAGKGFVVKKGMKIGLNSGEVVDIEKDKLLILETIVDFTGQKKTKTIEMKLRTKDQDDRLKRGQ